MKVALNWIKSNPISVASIVVVILSLGFLVWVQIQGSALTERMANRGNTISQLRSLNSRSVEIPPEEPDAPEQTVNGVTLNPVAIDQISMLYDRMDEEYREIFAQAVAINRDGHEPLVEGLFPSSDASLRFLAKTEYLRAFDTMLDPYPPQAQGEPLPRLDAGMPPYMEEITQAVARVDAQFRSSPGMAGQQFTLEDEQALFEEKRLTAIEMLTEVARNIHIYAADDVPPGDPMYPFQVLPWALLNDLPQEAHIWEGQLELWIQQDLVQAIAMTNNVADPDVNVMEAPIKRLIKIEVIPGYVGLHTLGALAQPMRLQPRPDGALPPPIPGLTGSPDTRVSDNFHVGPTGRVSNALYDVRHARLQIVVDYERLPELFDNLSRVNFMTVLSVELEDVDEYRALEEGYVYGSDDVVLATLAIETIWLRSWTEQLMPSIVRQYVGLDDPVDLGDPQQQMMDPMMMDPFGGMGGYGDPGMMGY